MSASFARGVSWLGFFRSFYAFNFRDLCTTYCAGEFCSCDFGYRARGTIVQVRFSKQTSPARYSCAEVSLKRIRRLSWLQARIL